uniref:Methylosome subunit pICln n=2 Tax=Acrobeloides nanus TaxID=290746 RepID=A0A914DXW4_9BILA
MKVGEAFSSFGILIMAQVLKTVHEPTEGLRLQQINVTAFFETINCGIGKLYLTERTVTWINADSRQGFVLHYPAIAVHAATGANEDFPEPCLFLMIDLSKTDIEYTPETTESDDEEESNVRTAAIRLVPEDSGTISHIYQVMNECQELNPESEEEMSEGDDDGMEDEEYHNGEGDDNPVVYEAPNAAQWYTAETPDDEIQLSEQGRANLERILGNLDDKPPAQNSRQDPDHTMDEG